jgi:hypothetical protein
MTRAAFTAGAPTPEVFDEVTVGGRFGVVLQRLDWPTLAQLSRSGAMAPKQTGGILSPAHRHWHPHRDRAPGAGGQAVPWQPSPRQRDHDGG